MRMNMMGVDFCVEKEIRYEQLEDILVQDDKSESKKDTRGINNLTSEVRIVQYNILKITRSTHKLGRRSTLVTSQLTEIPI